jgi:hypothetical protein
MFLPTVFPCRKWAGVCSRRKKRGVFAEQKERQASRCAFLELAA